VKPGTSSPTGEPRVTIVCGHYGTGKSECSIALVRRAPAPATLVDLDVVNPYFRSREARALLEGEGITVIGNSLGIDAGIDLPAIPGTVVPALTNGDRNVVVDLGGDPVGARALRQFRPSIPTEDTAVLYVVNAYRPGNADATATIASIRAIEGEIGMHCTGLINNSHLLSETTCAHLAHGQAVCADVSAVTGLPIVFTTARAEVLEECRRAEISLAGNSIELSGALRQGWMDQRR
jgi:hypothetical protein